MLLFCSILAILNLISQIKLQFLWTILIYIYLYAQQCLYSLFLLMCQTVLLDNFLFFEVYYIEFPLVSSSWVVKPPSFLFVCFNLKL